MPVQRMGVVAVDVYFGKHREADVVVRLAEGPDLGVRPRLLLAELVAGKAEHDQPPFPVLPIKGFQTLILRRVATLAGDVDDQ